MNPNIQQISELIPQCQEKIKQINSDLAASSRTGYFDGRGLKDCATQIIKDIQRLNQKDHLQTYFSANEISQINSALTQIQQYAPRYPQEVYSSLNTLQPIVRSYWIRNRSQAEEDRYRQCEEALIDLEEILQRRNEIEQEAESARQSTESLNEKITALEEKLEELIALESAATTSANDISELLSESKTEAATIEAKRKTIDEFTEKITKREKDLERLIANTDAYSEKLENLETLNKKKQTELSEMIEDAKKALNLNTAIGLSREFQAKAESLRPRFGFTFSKEGSEKTKEGPERTKEGSEKTKEGSEKTKEGSERTKEGSEKTKEGSEKTKERPERQIPKLKTTNFIGYWLVGSGVFVVLALTLALALMAGEVEIFGATLKFQKDEWYQVMGRLSIVGLLVSAAVFCAKQFTKNGRILEEYAYKKVVSATLPSFLQQLEGKQLNTTSLESKYLLRAIEELHENPLDFLNGNKDKGNKNSNFQMDEFTKIQSELLTVLKKLENTQNANP